MNPHDHLYPKQIQDGWWRVTCSCGRMFDRRTEDAAVRAHRAHVGIEDARTALKGNAG